jgi:hypothetical protein
VKKGNKGVGTDSASDEDTPKLRCTFCRRKYAGVNAKSMWRRHVLEKHKIPMANRRDGPHDGGRTGRSSNSMCRPLVVSQVHVQLMLVPGQRKTSTSSEVADRITSISANPRPRRSHVLNL